MAEQYHHKNIEAHWQKVWNEEKTYRTLYATEALEKKKQPFYALDMFPYPSGAGLHVGHPRGYIGSDVLSRLKRMQGYNVLHPMGFDSFGLPAEQYAIKTGNHPGPFTDNLIQRYKEQLSILGFSYDWDREVATHDPEYYRWTQWIFLQLYNSYYDNTTKSARPITDLVDEIISNTHNEISAEEWSQYSHKEQGDFLMRYRLAYEGYSEVNWCEELGTVLAHDEIIEQDGKMVSERGNHPVEKKSMRQWFMRITAYAERLLSGLETLDWSHNIKEIQRNWIGKSYGAEIPFTIQHNDSDDITISVFTTRPDTLYGVTALVIAPEHSYIQELIESGSIENESEVRDYIHSTQQKTQIDRMKDNQDKTGVLLKGVRARHPLTHNPIHIWIADYVLADYGTGAVMMVPAHDERDFAFAQQYNIPIIHVIGDERAESCMTEHGIMINSDEFNGKNSQDIQKVITEKAGGTMTIRYKMRDAIFARQRYWGEPIPIIHQTDGTLVEVPEDMLPLELPVLESFQPAGNGESPLSTDDEWVRNGYETNTMPGWAGSSWYFLRYTDPQNSDAFASSEELEYWFSQDGGVNMYVGGQEHATGHLLYARFWHMFLYDRGFVSAPEPFKALRNQGMIGGPDGRKMSKRYGNVINPDDVVEHVGADALRVFEMFLGPFESHLPWSLDGVAGSRRFIEKVWYLKNKVSDTSNDKDEYYSLLHKTIEKVHDDIERFSFNTAISALMIFVKECEQIETIAQNDFEDFLKIVAPFAPYITEEIWRNTLGHTESIHLSPWPQIDSEALIETTVTLPIQVNGKVRSQIIISVDESEEDVLHKALHDEAIMSWIQDAQIIKKIYVPKRIINIVIKQS